jgi:hypothetical protein
MGLHIFDLLSVAEKLKSSSPDSLMKYFMASAISYDKAKLTCQGFS